MHPLLKLLLLLFQLTLSPLWLHQIFTFKILPSYTFDLDCITLDFILCCSRTWMSFLQSANFTFISLRFLYISVAVGLAIHDTWGDLFFFFSKVEAWTLTYYVNFFASGLTALRYCFFIVGWDTSFLDFFETPTGETHLNTFFFVVDFLLPEPTVFNNFGSDLYFFMVGLIKYSFSSYSYVSYFDFYSFDCFFGFLLGCS